MTTHPYRRVELGDPLTDREKTVLLHTARGLGNSGVAKHLHLSLDTVKTHLRTAFVKLGAHDRAHVVALAFQAGHLWVGVDKLVHADTELRRRLVA